MNILEFTADDDLFPNSNFSLCLWRNSNLILHDVMIKVLSPTKKIKISLDSNKKEYEPGDFVSYRIKTSNIKNSPSSCEVSLGVVDESVYHLVSKMVNDIYYCFYGNRPFGFFRSYKPRVNYYYSKISIKEQVIPDLITWVPSPPTPDIDKTTPRQYFPDTCYFNPHIITDENGEAVVHFSPNISSSFHVH